MDVLLYAARVLNVFHCEHANNSRRCPLSGKRHVVLLANGHSAAEVQWTVLWAMWSGRRPRDAVDTLVPCLYWSVPQLPGSVPAVRSAFMTTSRRDLLRTRGARPSSNHIISYGHGMSHAEQRDVTHPHVSVCYQRYARKVSHRTALLSHRKLQGPRPPMTRLSPASADATHDVVSFGKARQCWHCLLPFCHRLQA